MKLLYKTFALFVLALAGEMVVLILINHYVIHTILLETDPAERDSARQVLGLAGLLIFLFAVLISLFWIVITQRFAAQLANMARVTGKMANLKFDEKVTYDGKDEIGELADSINRMSDKLSVTIREMEEELARRGNLVRNLAHDIRTPVTVIRGYAENLEYLYPQEEKILKYSGIIVEECDHLHGMSENMIEMCRIREGYDVGDMEEISMEDLFGTFRSHIQNTMLNIKVDITFDPALVRGNRFLLERAVYNLLTNAFRYGDTDKTIFLSGTKKEGRYIFSVKNTGPAIDAKDIPYIWDAFFKTDRARNSEGYGIGLAIVKETALLHSGGVEALSNEGETVFSFWIKIG